MITEEQNKNRKNLWGRRCFKYTECILEIELKVILKSLEKREREGKGEMHGEGRDKTDWVWFQSMVSGLISR